MPPRLFTQIKNRIQQANLRFFMTLSSGALLYTRPQGAKTCIEKWREIKSDIVVFFGKYLIKAETGQNNDERP